MNFNFASSLKVINSFNIGLRYNYLFGSSRQNNISYINSDAFINTFRSKYEGSFFRNIFQL